MTKRDDINSQLANFLGTSSESEKITKDDSKKEQSLEDLNDKVDSKHKEVEEVVEVYEQQPVQDRGFLSDGEHIKSAVDEIEKIISATSSREKLKVKDAINPVEETPLTPKEKEELEKEYNTYEKHIKEASKTFRDLGKNSVESEEEPKKEKSAPRRKSKEQTKKSRKLKKANSINKKKESKPVKSNKVTEKQSKKDLSESLDDIENNNIEKTVVIDNNHEDIVKEVTSEKFKKDLHSLLDDIEDNNVEKTVVIDNSQEDNAENNSEDSYNEISNFKGGTQTHEEESFEVVEDPKSEEDYEEDIDFEPKEEQVDRSEFLLDGNVDIPLEANETGNISEEFITGEAKLEELPKKRGMFAKRKERKEQRKEQKAITKQRKKDAKKIIDEFEGIFNEDEDDFPKENNQSSNQDFLPSTIVEEEPVKSTKSKAKSVSLNVTLGVAFLTLGGLGTYGGYYVYQNQSVLMEIEPSELVKVTTISPSIKDDGNMAMITIGKGITIPYKVTSDRIIFDKNSKYLPNYIVGVDEEIEVFSTADGTPDQTTLLNNFLNAKTIKFKVKRTSQNKLEAYGFETVK